jgi:SAM-dependent methyltransferase
MSAADRNFERPSISGFTFSQRRGPASAVPSVAETSWGNGLPAVAAEHRGSLAEAEADAAYRWAAGAVSGRDVLDVGCGAGHGSATLKRAGATSVTGVDPDPRTTTIATREHGTECRFLAAEPHALPLSPGSFGAVVCLAPLEHASDPGALLDSLAGLLCEDGILLVSLPTGPPRDEIDGHELGPARDVDGWLAELGERWEHVSAWRRRVAIAATVTAAESDAEAAAEPAWLGAERAEDRSLLVAAANQPLPELGPTTTMVGSRDLRAYRETVEAWEQRARRAEADGSAKHWELVASREAQRRLRKRLWQLEHRPLRKLFRVLRGRPAKLTEGPPLRPAENDAGEDWI